MPSFRTAVDPSASRLGRAKLSLRSTCNGLVVLLGKGRHEEHVACFAGVEGADAQHLYLEPGADKCSFVARTRAVRPHR